MKKKLIIIFSIILLIITGIFIYIKIPEQPTYEMKTANDIIIRSEKAEANKYATENYNEIKKLYDSAMFYWKVENEKFILFRNYDKVINLSNEIRVKGNETYTIALRNFRSIEYTSTMLFIETENRIKNFKDKYYNIIPLTDSLKFWINKSFNKFNEAKIYLEKKDFYFAKYQLDISYDLLVKSENEIKNILQKYFESYPIWIKLVDEAIKKSKQEKNIVIIVDKMAHECLLYQYGELKYNFKSEFGPNWITKKLREGDKATPEGIYHVTKKIKGRGTKYYKALLINYPNFDDLIRFRRSIDNGLIPYESEIGGLIEIHGKGGLGFDWTNGCVGLTNKDMDTIYNITSIRTPVIIVGSIKPIENYIR